MSEFIIKIGVSNGLADTSLFVYNKLEYSIGILVNVDDLIVIGNNAKALESVIKVICGDFRCRDFGILKIFLRIEVIRKIDG